MGATCAKCCLCYCFKLSLFGERFRCSPCCRQCCGEFCQCGDCCDVEEDDVSPFMDGDEAKKEGDEALVYPNGDTYVGQLQNSKKHGYGELIRKDGTRMKGYFIQDEFVGETSEAAKAVRQHSKTDREAGRTSAQGEPSFSQPGCSGGSAADQTELLPVT